MTENPGVPAAGDGGGSAPGSGTTVLHLVRHGEVYNPGGILYGRLPGFHLSEEGRLMAKAAAGFLAGRDVVLLRSSPLDRTMETAAPLVAQFDLELITEERLIEPTNVFEGTTVGVGSGALRNPANWRYLYDPFRPSWGEAYRGVAARMLAVMADVARAAQGHEAVCVSHQLPIWIARRAAEGKHLWHHPGHRQCALASVTSFSYSSGEITGVSYAEPGGSGSGRPQTPGA
ncbi:MAG TPA: histidine phosphatase family protein [Streptosporangiaceae bacterium]|nr:histidine phosphatase family protein [Streptosporangiaceae bacterium]